jgi:hypothetical protein
MDIEKQDEYRIFRRTFPGQIKNFLAGLCVLTGLFFWFHNQNLWLVIPMGVFAPIAVNLPALVYTRVDWMHERFSLKLLQVYEYCVVLVLALSTSGSAYLFYLHYQFDILVHYTENVIFAFLIVLALNLYRQHKGKSPYSTARAAWLIFFVGISFSLFWEGYQYSCDRLFKTRMAFDSFQSWLDDSASDVAGGTLGLIVFIPLIIIPFWNHINLFIRRDGTARGNGVKNR